MRVQLLPAGLLAGLAGLLSGIVAGCTPSASGPEGPETPATATPGPETSALPSDGPAGTALPPTAAAARRAELETMFAFETPAGEPPATWKVSPEHTGVIDATTVHGGHGALRLDRTVTTPRPFSSVATRIPIDFSGESVELRGFLRTADVTASAGFWLREDGDAGAVKFINMEDAKLSGTTEWKEFAINLPLDPSADDLVLGVLLVGTGTVWADDLRVLVDGKPIWEAPRANKPAVAHDPAFDHGSGISITQLTPQQTENLTVLGEVWGFLKYHHPAVTSGKLHWDAQLLHQLPAVFAAPDRARAEAAMVTWIDGLGLLAPCQPCATLDEKDLVVRPDHAWQATLGEALRSRLAAVDAARVPDQQYYVSLAPGVGNPVFAHESTYSNLKFPDAGFQYLALVRLWNIIEYWAPYRSLADHWADQLQALIPSVMLATTDTQYAVAMMGAIAKLHDGHANLWSSLDVRPPVGPCELQVGFRFVGKRPVATASLGVLQRGDVVTSIDGTPMEKLVAQWAPLYASSNEAAQLRDIAANMTHGACGQIALGLDRNGTARTITLPRTPSSGWQPRTHDLPGPAFRMLSPDIAYLKLSEVDASDIPNEVQQAANTKGWIIDIRNYPKNFVVFALGSLLVDKDTPFVRFTNGDLSNPGAFHWTDAISLQASTPHYGGKIVILIDELSQSQSEYTTMALRSSPHAVVVGSTTAGADGNISPFSFPGGLSTMISGIGVFYPDNKPTQQVGIVPDVVARPTVAGIRAGRDEVLEAGIRVILGPSAKPSAIQKIVSSAQTAH